MEQISNNYCILKYAYSHWVGQLVLSNIGLLIIKMSRYVPKTDGQFHILTNLTPSEPTMKALDTKMAKYHETRQIDFPSLANILSCYSRQKEIYP